MEVVMEVVMGWEHQSFWIADACLLHSKHQVSNRGFLGMKVSVPDVRNTVGPSWWFEESWKRLSCFAIPLHGVEKRTRVNQKDSKWWWKWWWKWLLNESTVFLDRRCLLAICDGLRSYEEDSLASPFLCAESKSEKRGAETTRVVDGVGAPVFLDRRCLSSFVMVWGVVL